MMSKFKIHFALFIVALIYGATFTIAKEVMNGFIPPFAFIMLRIWTATVLLFIFHTIFIKEKISNKNDLGKIFVCAIFGVVANMLLFFKGLSLTVPINGSVLMMNTPIFVVIFAALILKEKIAALKITGILIASTGAILLIAGTHLVFSSATAIGDILVTANAIIYAFYLVFVKPLTQKYHPLTITLYCFMIGSILVIPFAWNDFIQLEWAAFPVKIWMYTAFVTIGATFFTYVLNAYALRHASPALVGTYIYLQPVLATFIAIFSGKDMLTFQKMIFIVIIFSGVYLVSKKSKIR